MSHQTQISRTSRQCLPFTSFLLTVPVLLIACSAFLVQPTNAAGIKVGQTKQQQQQPLDIYPKRRSHESAVIEWGHSAVISAIDAVVANFGPQTSRGAYFEVETMPLLANPIDGSAGMSQEDPDVTQPDVKTPFFNADELHGNAVVMTNAAGFSPVQMAKMAVDSGAAALLVVNTDAGTENPDFIYSMVCETTEECEYAEQYVDIPVVMISLTSGNVLTTADEDAQVDETQGQEPTYSMPDRVRLYASGDRPFFEDVSHFQPVVYLIHHLLTDLECDDLIAQADKSTMQPFDAHKSNILEGTSLPDPKTKKGDSNPGAKLDRTYLWRGLLKSFGEKAIDERIEQVTGFPRDHLSEFQVNKFQTGGYQAPHLDFLPKLDSAAGAGAGAGAGVSQMASIHVFLSDVSEEDGGEFRFGSRFQIRPKKGMAIVYHNLDENDNVDASTLHSELEYTGDSSSTPKYSAKLYVNSVPTPYSRTLVLPILALPTGGRLNQNVRDFHDFFLDRFGDAGGAYFDKAMVGIPVLLLLALLQLIFYLVQQQSKASDATSTVPKDSTPSSSPKKAKKKSKSGSKSKGGKGD